jgi:glutamyl-tRNA synthetase
LLDSTPRQIALYRALGYPIPRFAHVGLVVDASGKRLAKRHGASSIESLRESGRSAQDVIGELAYSLGLTADDKPIRPEELIPSFELTQISRSSFIWDPKG